ncbi:hypothetical protein CBR_g23491 [Chara braunii]|uniref:CCHC-type domain-containing protein n=1 Tax=Chara braunii TaxID=69332 RepID=A0A388L4C8_CHABU|nr:hypothetical protein CBR_g23491 [Chara braunii]|eukprot:GBG77165.1 hypothetical protein CBR_g23491 [Chara braunii]
MSDGNQLSGPNDSGQGTHHRRKTWSIRLGDDGSTAAGVADVYSRRTLQGENLSGRLEFDLQLSPSRRRDGPEDSWGEGGGGGGGGGGDGGGGVRLTSPEVAIVFRTDGIHFGTGCCGGPRQLGPGSEFGPGSTAPTPAGLSGVGLASLPHRGTAVGPILSTEGRLSPSEAAKPGDKNWVSKEPRETLARYTQRFTHLAERFGMYEKMVRTDFVWGLFDSRLRKKIRKKCNPIEHTLTVLIQYAIEYEKGNYDVGLDSESDDNDPSGVRRYNYSATTRMFEDRFGLGPTKKNPDRRAPSSSSASRRPIQTQGGRDVDEPSMKEIAAQLVTVVATLIEFVQSLQRQRAIVAQRHPMAATAGAALPRPAVVGATQSMRCYNCNQLRHLAKDCPRPRAQVGVAGLSQISLTAPTAAGQGPMAAVMDAGTLDMVGPTAVEIGIDEYLAAAMLELGTIAVIRHTPRVTGESDLGPWRPGFEDPTIPGLEYKDGQIDVLDALKALDLRIRVPIPYLLTISEAANEKLIERCLKNQRRFEEDRRGKKLAINDPSVVVEAQPSTSKTHEANRVGMIHALDPPPEKREVFLRVYPITWKSVECDCEVWGSPSAAILDFWIVGRSYLLEFDEAFGSGETMALEKSEFFMSEISFSGYIVTVDGLKLDPRTMTVVQEAPVSFTLAQPEKEGTVALYPFGEIEMSRPGLLELVHIELLSIAQVIASKEEDLQLQLGTSSAPRRSYHAVVISDYIAQEGKKVVSIVDRKSRQPPSSYAKPAAPKTLRKTPKKRHRQPSSEAQESRVGLGEEVDQAVRVRKPDPVPESKATPIEGPPPGGAGTSSFRIRRSPPESAPPPPLLPDINLDGAGLLAPAGGVGGVPYPAPKTPILAGPFRFRQPPKLLVKGFPRLHILVHSFQRTGTFSLGCKLRRLTRLADGIRHKVIEGIISPKAGELDEQRYSVTQPDRRSLSLGHRSSARGSSAALAVAAPDWEGREGASGPEKRRGTERGPGKQSRTSRSGSSAQTGDVSTRVAPPSVYQRDDADDEDEPGPTDDPGGRRLTSVEFPADLDRGRVQGRGSTPNSIPSPRGSVATGSTPGSPKFPPNPTASTKTDAWQGGEQSRPPSRLAYHSRRGTETESFQVEEGQDGEISTPQLTYPSRRVTESESFHVAEGQEDVRWHPNAKLSLGGISDVVRGSRITLGPGDPEGTQALGGEVEFNGVASTEAGYPPGNSRQASVRELDQLGPGYGAVSRHASVRASLGQVDGRGGTQAIGGEVEFNGPGNRRQLSVRGSQVRFDGSQGDVPFGTGAEFDQPGPSYGQTSRHASLRGSRAQGDNPGGNGPGDAGAELDQLGPGYGAVSRHASVRASLGQVDGRGGDRQAGTGSELDQSAPGYAPTSRHASVRGSRLQADYSTGDGQGIARAELAPAGSGNFAGSRHTSVRGSQIQTDSFGGDGPVGSSAEFDQLAPGYAPASRHASVRGSRVQADNSTGTEPGVTGAELAPVAGGASRHSSVRGSQVQVDSFRGDGPAASGAVLDQFAQGYAPASRHASVRGSQVQDGNSTGDGPDVAVAALAPVGPGHVTSSRHTSVRGSWVQADSSRGNEPVGSSAELDQLAPGYAPASRHASVRGSHALADDYTGDGQGIAGAELPPAGPNYVAGSRHTSVRGSQVQADSYRGDGPGRSSAQFDQLAAGYAPANRHASVRGSHVQADYSAGSVPATRHASLQFSQVQADASRDGGLGGSGTELGQWGPGYGPASRHTSVRGSQVQAGGLGAGPAGAESGQLGPGIAQPSRHASIRGSGVQGGDFIGNEPGVPSAESGQLGPGYGSASRHASLQGSNLQINDSGGGGPGVGGGELEPFGPGYGPASRHASLRGSQVQADGLGGNVPGGAGTESDQLQPGFNPSNRNSAIDGPRVRFHDSAENGPGGAGAEFGQLVPGSVSGSRHPSLEGPMFPSGGRGDGGPSAYGGELGPGYGPGSRHTSVRGSVAWDDGPGGHGRDGPGPEWDGMGLGYDPATRHSSMQGFQAQGDGSRGDGQDAAGAESAYLTPDGVPGSRQASMYGPVVQAAPGALRSWEGGSSGVQAPYTGRHHSLPAFPVETQVGRSQHAYSVPNVHYGHGGRSHSQSNDQNAHQHSAVTGLQAGPDSQLIAPDQQMVMSDGMDPNTSGREFPGQGVEGTSQQSMPGLNSREEMDAQVSSHARMSVGTGFNGEAVQVIHNPAAEYGLNEDRREAGPKDPCLSAAAIESGVELFLLAAGKLRVAAQEMRADLESSQFDVVHEIATEVISIVETVAVAALEVADGRVRLTRTEDGGDYWGASDVNGDQVMEEALTGPGVVDDFTTSGERGVGSRSFSVPVGGGGAGGRMSRLSSTKLLQALTNRASQRTSQLQGGGLALQMNTESDGNGLQSQGVVAKRENLERQSLARIPEWDDDPYDLVEEDLVWEEGRIGNQVHSRQTSMLASQRNDRRKSTISPGVLLRPSQLMHPDAEDGPQAGAQESADSGRRSVYSTAEDAALDRRSSEVPAFPMRGSTSMQIADGNSVHDPHDGRISSRSSLATGLLSGIVNEVAYLDDPTGKRAASRSQSVFTASQGQNLRGGGGAPLFRSKSEMISSGMLPSAGGHDLAAYPSQNLPSWQPSSQEKKRQSSAKRASSALYEEPEVPLSSIQRSSMMSDTEDDGRDGIDERPLRAANSINLGNTEVDRRSSARSKRSQSGLLNSRSPSVFVASQGGHRLSGARSSSIGRQLSAAQSNEPQSVHPSTFADEPENGSTGASIYGQQGSAHDRSKAMAGRERPFKSVPNVTFAKEILRRRHTEALDPRMSRRVPADDSENSMGLDPRTGKLTRFTYASIREDLGEQEEDRRRELEREDDERRMDERDEHEIWPEDSIIDDLINELVPSIPDRALSLSPEEWHQQQQERSKPGADETEYEISRLVSEDEMLDMEEFKDDSDVRGKRENAWIQNGQRQSTSSAVSRPSQNLGVEQGRPDRHSRRSNALRFSRAKSIMVTSGGLKNLMESNGSGPMLTGGGSPGRQVSMTTQSIDSLIDDLMPQSRKASMAQRRSEMSSRKGSAVEYAEVSQSARSQLQGNGDQEEGGQGDGRQSRKTSKQSISSSVPTGRKDSTAPSESGPGAAATVQRRSTIPTCEMKIDEMPAEMLSGATIERRSSDSFTERRPSRAPDRRESDTMTDRRVSDAKTGHRQSNPVIDQRGSIAMTAGRYSDDAVMDRRQSDAMNGRRQSEFVNDQRHSFATTDRRYTDAMPDRRQSDAVTDRRQSDGMGDRRPSDARTGHRQSDVVIDQRYSIANTSDRSYADATPDRRQSDALTDRRESDAMASRRQSDAVTDRRRSDTVSDQRYSEAVSGRKYSDAMTDKRYSDAMLDRRQNSTVSDWAQSDTMTDRRQSNAVTDRRQSNAVVERRQTEVMSDRRVSEATTDRRQSGVSRTDRGLSRANTGRPSTSSTIYGGVMDRGQRERREKEVEAEGSYSFSDGRLEDVSEEGGFEELFQ